MIYQIEGDAASASASRGPSPSLLYIKRRHGALPWTIRVSSYGDGWIVSGRNELADEWVQLARLCGCSFAFAQVLWPLHTLARDLLVKWDSWGLSFVRNDVRRCLREIGEREPAVIVEDASPEVREFIENTLPDARKLLDLDLAALRNLQGGGRRR
jgi:hypothetical protein